MRRSFYLPVHAGPVKCVAAAAPFVATGGADDTIHLFDVAAHADLGFLMSPGDGAVTAIAMYAPRGDDGAPGRPTHLLSGAATVPGFDAVEAVHAFAGLDAPRSPGAALARLRERGVWRLVGFRSAPAVWVHRRARPRDEA